jgi:hypothetical protein
MRKILLVLSLTISFFISNFTARTQILENPFSKSDVINVQQRQPNSQIKSIRAFDENSAIAYTNDKIFRTDDNGDSWREIASPKSFSQSIGTINFLNENTGWAILADRQHASLELVKTNDGGNSWMKSAVNLRLVDLQEAELDNVSLEFSDERKGTLKLHLPSSSNFSRQAIYTTNDGGVNWIFETSATKQKDRDEGFSISKQEIKGFPVLENISNSENIIQSSPVTESNWILTSEGDCDGFKSGCAQTTKIYKVSKNRLKEVTPPELKESGKIEKENTENPVQSQMPLPPPGGSTRISLDRGFDKCTAAPVSQMKIWWDTSPFYDSNIYISGRNRGCSQALLNAAWVNQVSAMGWGLIPTIVGYQAPCSVCTTCQKHSTDPAAAETQGRGEADIAISDANNLELTRGTVLYYDMERYDDLSGTGACSTPVKSFLKGWTDRLKEQGYISGVYGSPTNAVNDWINIPPASQMDVVWLARWNNVASVWGVAPLPDTYWTNHQRIHQYQGPHNETWGGVTFNIDSDIEDAPVAGAKIPKNKSADFDGDGKTDVSVFRPDTGVWYVLNSQNSTFTAVTFGLGTDVLAPGDFDGDGKTDFAVWRPSNGVWYVQSRSIFRAQQFGTDGDIPVPADYDGDGRTDFAVFRPSNGVWYIKNSFDSRGTSFRFEQFGTSGDKPVPGDYDGDGKTDIAVYRPSDGNWYLMKSSQGFAAINFGISTDKPVQADYDGDGKTDLGVYRGGVWYMLQSQAGFAATQFGIASDKPAAGDFDGDNKADFSVFRPENGVWYILQTQSGFSSTQFGNASDRPTPAAYFP